MTEGTSYFTASDIFILVEGEARCLLLKTGDCIMKAQLAEQDRDWQKKTKRILALVVEVAPAPT